MLLKNWVIYPDNPSRHTLDGCVAEGTCVGRCKGLQKPSALPTYNISKTKDLAKSCDPTTALELLNQLSGEPCIPDMPRRQLGADLLGQNNNA
jgi:hypothetical protein